MTHSETLDVTIPEISIVLLEHDNNRKGDLFTRLCTDFFQAIGYTVLQRDTPRPGYELDIQGRHRVESDVLLVAECKAHSNPIGGADLHKFMGAIATERRKRVGSGRRVTGYFLSLSGFTASAREIESEKADPPVTLIDARKIAHELAVGHYIVPPLEAVGVTLERIRQLHPSASIRQSATVTLLGHKRGWLWLVQIDTAATAYHAILYPDGTLASNNLLRELDLGLIQGERAIPAQSIPIAPTSYRDAHSESSEKDYRRRLADIYGHITLEGLPADTQLGSRAFDVQKLFVPPRLQPLASGESLTKGSLRDYSRPGNAVHDRPGSPFSESLARGRKLAILGLPGSGKTTLIKRVATAYASEVARRQVDDSLPPLDQLPLIIRCRNLSADFDSIDRAIETAILSTGCLNPGTTLELIKDKLRSGDILLLVDGVDEIPEDAKRLIFAEALQVFLSRYPGITVIATLRPTGYRSVAPLLAPVLEPLEISPLNAEEGTTLCINWYKETTEGPDSEEQGRMMAESLIRNERLAPFTQNPLLLVTLLLVSRVTGGRRPPSKRVELYAKAIDVLLTTWNVTGYDALSPGEALPQLSYAAWRMQQLGLTRATGLQLQEFFAEARSELRGPLGYVQDSPSQFLSSVEKRSNILSLVGKEYRQGSLVEYFEFSHLTFQEFLTALAVTRGWTDEATRRAALVNTMSIHLLDPAWSQVIPFVSALSENEQVVSWLSGELSALRPARRIQQHDAAVGEPVWQLLIACMLEEPTVEPATARSILKLLLRSDYSSSILDDGVRALGLTKFAGVFWEALLDAFFVRGADVERLAEVAIAWEFATRPQPSLQAQAERAGALLIAGTRPAVIGASILVSLCRSMAREPSYSADRRLLESDSWTSAVRHASIMIAEERSFSPIVWLLCVALGWHEYVQEVANDSQSVIYSRVVQHWVEMGDTDAGGACAWSLYRLPSTISLSNDEDSTNRHLERQFLGQGAYLSRSAERRAAALAVARNRNAPWSSGQLADMALNSGAGSDYYINWTDDFLFSLGDVGVDYLEILEVRAEEVAQSLAAEFNLDADGMD